MRADAYLRHVERASWVLLVATVAFALLGGALGASWARELRATLIDGAIAIPIAGLVGLSFGFLGGAGVRSANVLLARLLEVTASIPSPLLACAVLAITRSAPISAAALGVARGLGIAWLLQARLKRRRETLKLESRSLSRTPLAVYYRTILPAAAPDLLEALAFTLPWLAAVDMSAVLLRLSPLAERASLGAAAARGSTPAALALIVLAGAFYAAATLGARRLAPDSSSAPESEIVLPLRRPAARARNETP